jgi:RNA polymerase sigma factor (sigma-70 family)
MFLDHLDVVERAIRFVTRRALLRDQDAEDFSSFVMLKLIQKDYAVIESFDGRSSFGAFISVVVQRLFLDYRIAQWGKWHASAIAKRLGEPAITIEEMLYRDGRTLDEVVEILPRRRPTLTRQTIESLANQLPRRFPRAREVSVELAEGSSASWNPEQSMMASHRAALAQRVTDCVKAAMKNLDETDRLVLRLRFEGGMSIAEIARALDLQQKPMYRRMQRALFTLRGALVATGVGTEDIEEILSDPGSDLDFGFEMTKERETQDQESK